jgi:hypothetical protein
LIEYVLVQKTAATAATDEDRVVGRIAPGGASTPFPKSMVGQRRIVTEQKILAKPVP